MPTRHALAAQRPARRRADLGVGPFVAATVRLSAHLERDDPVRRELARVRDLEREFLHRAERAVRAGVGGVEGRDRDALADAQVEHHVEVLFVVARLLRVRAGARRARVQTVPHAEIHARALALVVREQRDAHVAIGKRGQGRIRFLTNAPEEVHRGKVDAGGQRDGAGIRVVLRARDAGSRRRASWPRPAQHG